jgi:hypothetical protein
MGGELRNADGRKDSPYIKQIRFVFKGLIYVLSITDKRIYLCYSYRVSF